MISRPFCLLSVFFSALAIAAPVDLAALKTRAEKGEAQAQYELAEAHYWGRHNATIDHNASHHWASKSAKQNHAQGTYRLGVMQVLGHGTTAQLKEGVQRLAKALPQLEKGGAEARFQHALLIMSGVAIDPSTTKVNELVKASAEAGLPEAQFRMGLLNVGVGARAAKRIPQPQEAKLWWTKAAAQGHELAQFHLAELHADGRHQMQNNATARQWFQKSAEGGLAIAQNRLGHLHLRGWGGPVDANASAQWIRKAAEQGTAPAQRDLGLLYYQGAGVAKSVPDAYYWLALAAQQGLTDARQAVEGMGELLTSDQLFTVTKRLRQFQAQPTPATQRYSYGLEYANPRLLRIINFEYANQRADQGDLAAKRILVDFYFSGMSDGQEKLIERDGAKVVGLVRELAEKDDTFGMWNLAVMYNQGVTQTERNPKDPTKIEQVTLVARDFNASAKWLQKAAGKGDTRSMVALAIAYEKGEGVDRNQTTAWKFYTQAAQKGDPDAMYGIAVAIEDKWPAASKEPVPRLEWLRKAAELGNVHSQYALYEAHLEGKGVPKDSGHARRWVTRAAQQGFPPAQFKLGAMLANGDGGAKDNVQALKWLYLAANARIEEAGRDFKRLQPTLTADEISRVRQAVEDYLPVPERDPDASAAPPQDIKALLALAQKGDAEAQVKLAQLQAQGSGGEGIERAQAYKWYTLAGEKGNAQAQAELPELISKMSTDELLEGRRLVRQAKEKKP
ncbi:MAG: sel1 repeat family protein [Pedosphaera sp.]|nr:sel1 repeat family protein [Pedosphaera sp.]